MSSLAVTYFKPYQPGIERTVSGFRFALVNKKNGCESGILLYDDKKQEQRIPLSEKGRKGELFGVEIRGEDLNQLTYNFYDGDEVYTDPYVQGVAGLEQFGGKSTKERMTYGVLKKQDFDWEEDTNPEIPFEDTILYGIHVRAFTKHKSSNVAHPGTFEGIVEKIPYLKQLSITAVELMPCYEFDEVKIKPLYSDHREPEETKQKEEEGKKEVQDGRLNCWGFQKGFYFAPKASYSSKAPEISFKTMVRELHKAGIEVMMHFYFPEDISQGFMVQVLKFWTMEYHVDGFRINGFHLPVRMFLEEPVLKRSKLWLPYLPEEDLSCLEEDSFKHVAVDNGNFRNDIRRFLKGDEGLVNDFIRYQRRNPKEYAVMNAVCDYDGFSLMDLVSYDRKHNEANGENNADGTDYNYSWNCGVEGTTRKKNVLSLRKKQIKNAIAFLMLSQGTPFLFSGDEFGNSRLGNNNAYCQDNEVFWLQWKDNTQMFQELLSFTQKMIALRKQNPIIHMKKELKVMDSLGCGYPDISYHGAEAWRPDLSFVSRLVNIFLCGRYANEGDPFLYLAYNMHWEAHKLALPKLPKTLRWKRILSTEEEAGGKALKEMEADNGQVIESRSIAVYQTESSSK